MTQSFDLTGKKVLVTGASRGLGRTIATALAAAGADVAVGARSVSSLQTTCSEIREAGGTAIPLAFDVMDPRQCAQAVSEAVEALGGLDVLVNNAGTEQVGASLDVDEAQWDRILGTNLKGAFFSAQAAARTMIGGGRGGAIINLCSLASYVGIPTAAPYTASKSGLLGLTRVLAAEWAGAGIRVNAIAPGYFRTDMTEIFYQNEAWQETMLAKIPMGRFGEFADLGGIAVFLASDASVYITGQCVAVDGGFLASI